MKIIKKLKIPIYTTKKNPNFEMCTPTGLSLLKNFNHNEGLNGTIINTGYGAGNKDFDHSSNSVSVSWITNNDLNNLKIIEIPLPSNKIIHNKKLVASYINFYSTKNTIFIPKFNVKEDEEVYDIFKSLFNNKKIEMIESANINYGGGSLHCITMNVPKL